MTTRAKPEDSAPRKWAVIGGAGFIGSHLVAKLLAEGRASKVVVVDNFSSGSRELLGESADDARVQIVEGDAGDLDTLVAAVSGAEVLVHLASNPDIAAAVAEPMIDFRAGTVLTQNVIEACRRVGIARVVYASGSGVYGDLGLLAVQEDHGPMLPISTYGASKLAGEALLCSYAHMFGIRAVAFRFANVVGPRQTHGVGFDFLRKLAADPTHLEILGDGEQDKCYIHVDDVLAGVLLAEERVAEPYVVFNISTPDSVTVTEIAELACVARGLDPRAVRFDYTGGAAGWNGDVPKMRLSTDRIRALGWTPGRSARAAMESALASMVGQVA